MSQPPLAQPVPRRRAEWIVGLLIVALIGLIYAPAANYGFLDYDDDIYVRDFARVHQGLTLENVRWALTTFYFSNWHPLTWMSYMLDVSLFGVSPGAMHVVNVVLHAANSLLLFVLLRRTTGSFWCSALVGLLFAVHPTHVESVVWIAERKDVLSTFFLILAVAAYTRYSRSKSARAYVLLVVLYALSLMSKGMGVTFPALLLLWDAWPLRRVRWDNPANKLPRPTAGESWRQLILEKLPLLCMAIVAAGLNYAAQQQWGAVVTLSNTSLSNRIANASTSYLTYAGKLLVPVRLSPYYPYPDYFPPAMVIGGIAFLLLLLAVSWRYRSSHPMCLVGTLWYVGTLLPVIGLVQIGAQSMADRYTYVPSIGFGVVAAFGTAELVKQHSSAAKIIFVSSMILVLVYAIVARAQITHWRDTQSLFSYAAALDERNWVAHYVIGNEQSRKGQFDLANRSYLKCIELNPEFAESYKGVANNLLGRDPAEAIVYFEKALTLSPKDPAIFLGLGNAWRAAGDRTRATEFYENALELNPTLAAARTALREIDSSSIDVTPQKVQQFPN